MLKHASIEEMAMTNPKAHVPPTDADLLAAIDKWKEAWGTVRRLNDEDLYLEVAVRKAIKLEQKIARMPAMTTEGYRTQVEVIREADFDDEELLWIMFLLGRDAERLGIVDTPPDLCSDW
jgi:hypothetical protein